MGATGGKADSEGGKSLKRTYEKPAIVHEETLLARCVVWANSTVEACGPSGPLFGS